MKLYYVGSGSDLLYPNRCDGPFTSPEEAKDFLKQFITNYSPEMLALTITVADTDEKSLNLYKENNAPVTLQSLL